MARAKGTQSPIGPPLPSPEKLLDRSRPDPSMLMWQQQDPYRSGAAAQYPPPPYSLGRVQVSPTQTYQYYAPTVHYISSGDYGGGATFVAAVPNGAPPPPGAIRKPLPPEKVQALGVQLPMAQQQPSTNSPPSRLKPQVMYPPQTLRDVLTPSWPPTSPDNAQYYAAPPTQVPLPASQQQRLVRPAGIVESTSVATPLPRFVPRRPSGPTLAGGINASATPFSPPSTDVEAPAAGAEENTQ